MDWIPVGKELPEIDETEQTKNVLMTDGCGIWVGYFYIFKHMDEWSFSTNPADDRCEINRPTHWMPLPELPGD